jgi:hypothetical protein
MKMRVAVVLMAALAAFSVSAATVLEEWTFDNESNGESFSTLTNTAGTAIWDPYPGEPLDTPWNVVSNGVLKSFNYAGSSNTYNRAFLSTTNLTTGIYDVTYEVTDADFAPGLADKMPSFQMILRANEGIEVDDNIYQLRLTTSAKGAAGTNYVFQSRNPTTVNYPFSGLPGLTGFDDANPISNLTVRVRVDIENNEWSAYYKLATTAEQTLFENMDTYSTTWDSAVNVIRYHSTMGAETADADQFIDVDNITFTSIGPSLSQTYPEIGDENIISYQINEEAGTSIGALVQRGTDSGSLGGSIAGIETDGAGNLHFATNAASGGGLHSLDSAIENGQIIMDYRVSEWDFNGMAGTQQTKFQLKDSVGGNVINATFQFIAGNSRISWAGDNTVNANFTGVTNGTDLLVRTIVDLDAGTFDGWYNLNDAGWVMAGTGSNGLSSVDQFRLISSATLAGNLAEIKVDYANVSTIAAEVTVTTQVEEWNMNSSGDTYKKSDLATNFGVIYGTNDQSVAQVDGNGSFILAPEITQKSTKKDLAAAFDLTAGVVQLKVTVDSVDWSTNESLKSKTGWRIFENSTTSTNSVDLEFLVNNSRVFAYIKTSKGAMGEANQKGGRILNGLVGTIDSTDRTVILELDYANSEVRLFPEDRWQKPGTLPALVYTQAVDFASAGMTEVSAIQAYYANMTLGDEIVLDNIRLEQSVIVEEAPASYGDTVMQEWNFTKGSLLSESGTSAVFLNSAGNVDELFNDTLTVNRPTGTSGTVMLGDSANKANSSNMTAAITISEFDFSTSSNQFFSVRLIDGTTTVEELKFFADSSLGKIKVSGLGGVGGRVVEGLASSTPITYGVTLDFSGGTNGLGGYTLWAGSPDANDGWTYQASSFTGTVDLSSVNIDSLKWKIGNAETNGTFTLDRMIISRNTLAAPSTPAEFYAAWAATFGGGFTETALTDNPDGDVYKNLYEYGVGGNPTDGNINGNLPVASQQGSVIEYVYYRRDDAVSRGLTYEVQLETDLMLESLGWTNAPVTVTGTNVGAVAGFDAVTNEVSIDVEAKFIRLEVGSSF